jgi:small subunit ribosomal protein S14
MQAKIFKNVSFRNNFKKTEISSRVDKFLFINILNNVNLSKSASFRYLLNSLKTPKGVSKVKLKNTCVLTGRSRSVDKRMSLSRIQLRNMISFGIIPGYKKAVW